MHCSKQQQTTTPFQRLIGFLILLVCIAAFSLYLDHSHYKKTSTGIAALGIDLSLNYSQDPKKISTETVIKRGLVRKEFLSVSDRKFTITPPLGGDITIRPNPKNPGKMFDVIYKDVPDDYCKELAYHVSSWDELQVNSISSLGYETWDRLSFLRAACKVHKGNDTIIFTQRYNRFKKEH
jgi:hypothetical protein